MKAAASHLATNLPPNFYFRSKSWKWQQRPLTWQSSPLSSFTPANTTVNTTSLKVKERLTNLLWGEGFIRKRENSLQIMVFLPPCDVNRCQDCCWEKDVIASQSPAAIVENYSGHFWNWSWLNLKSCQSPASIVENYSGHFETKFLSFNCRALFRAFLKSI